MPCDRATKLIHSSLHTDNIEPTNEATPIQVTTSEYATLTSSTQATPTIVTSSPGLTTYVSEEVVIDEPVIVTSEDVPSADDESVEVLVTDDDDNVIALQPTQEIVQEVGEVKVM